MRQHRRSLSLVLLMAIVSVVSILVWLEQSRAQMRVDLLRSYISTLDEIIKYAHENYYKEVDEEKMLQGAIRGAVAALNDPYSFYQSPEEQQRERENLFRAQFGGLGIRIYPESEGEHALVKISQVLRNTPAERAGLRAGDAIIEVDGESVILGGPTGLTLNDVVGKLRGRVGDPVTIKIIRRNRMQPIEVELVREVIKLESVRWEVIEPGIAYIAVDSFTSQTVDEFVRAIDAIRAETELKALILDLRNNRGGMLSSAKGLSDAFLDEGIIVSTRGRNPDFNRPYPADPKVVVPKTVDVVVLVNGNSASGSEIVAGALKDLNRGILVGTKTFGKGVVQQRFELRNGGAVSLTISSYYTPNGTSIDGEGIEPNVVVEPETLSEEEVFFREKVREKRIIDKFVLKYIEEYEKEHGETPTDFAPLAEKVPEILEEIREAKLHLEPRTVLLEARAIFDLNVGIDRLIDIEYDRQLAEALRIIKEVGVAKVLDGSYPPKSDDDEATLN